jgi:hypothetical protein
MNQTALPPSEAAPGHNLPPETDATFDQLSSRTTALVENANRWIEERPEIGDDDQATKAGDFLDQLRSQIKEIEAERKTQKAPHMAAATAVDDKYNPLKRPVEIAGKFIKDKLTVWLKKQDEIKERERRAAEEVAHKAQEEADRAAAAAESPEGDAIGKAVAAEAAQKRAEETGRAAQRAAAAPKVASAYGGRSKSLRSHTVVEIEDATKIPAKYLRRLCARVYVTEALQRAVREDVSAYSTATEDGGLVSTVPGITIRKEKVAA